MAKEQVVPQALVLQNEHEKMLEKLRNIQLNNLTAKQQQNLSERKKHFGQYFARLSYSFFGLSADQLDKLDADELRVLDELISRKARPWAICQMIFTFGAPIVGWLYGSMVGLNNRDDDKFYSWSYLRHRKHLRKVYGEKFLSETLKHK